jgi:hypothetical protein
MSTNPRAMAEPAERFFGKYRGTVASNIDPKQMGRIQVRVPSVLGDGQMSWAMPCVPYAGAGVGLFMVPPVGANVWVEFEGGDLDHPIWAGCFWGPGEVPARPASPAVKILRTDSISLELDDTPGVGGLTCKVQAPAVPGTLTITCNREGIALTTPHGSLELTPSEVAIEQATASATLSPAGIKLENGVASVELSPVSVRINGDALEVL